MGISVSPVCCWSAEPVIYILLFINLLYIIGLIIVGLLFSTWSWAIALNSEETTDFKVVSIIIWVSYVIYFFLELYLGSYLLQSVNKMSVRSCREWIRAKYYQLSLMVFIVVMHSLMHYCIYEIIISSIIFLFTCYTMCVVSKFAQELSSLPQ